MSFWGCCSEQDWGKHQESTIFFLVATLSSVPLEMSDSLPICFSSVFIRYYFNILLRKQNKLRNYYFSYINLIELRYRSTE